MKTVIPLPWWPCTSFFITGLPGPAFFGVCAIPSRESLPMLCLVREAMSPLPWMSSSSSAMPWKLDYGICALSSMADIYHFFQDRTAKVSKLKRTRPEKLRTPLPCLESPWPAMTSGARLVKLKPLLPSRPPQGCLCSGEPLWKMCSSSSMAGL